MRQTPFIACAALFALLSFFPGAAGGEEQVPPPPLYDNLGDYHREISTRSKEAQRYFDQGLRLVYGFNHDEAQRAFEAAGRADPSCAICFWGVALTLGPNINLPAIPDRAAAAHAAEQTARRLAPKASSVECALISALAKRYSNPPPTDPEAQKRLDRAYAAAMKDVSRRFPKDLDVATLSAEAQMDLRPWDLWSADGKPRPGTVEIVRALEAVLAKNPNHPGANHYYIHAVEASPKPERALDAAARLGGMMPGAGHIVHMPSHIYIRTGRYEEAAEANRRAIQSDASYVAGGGASHIYAMYVAHNHQFLWAAAQTLARSAEAIQAARDAVQSVPIEMLQAMPGFDIALTYPVMSLLRFGRWEDVLKEPAPPAEFPFANAIRHYARAVALARLGRADEAETEKRAFTRLSESVPADAIESLNRSHDLLAVAAASLEGRLAAAAGDTETAVRRLEAGAAGEDRLRYAEPPDWYYPVRQTLGAVLLAAGRATDAERVYREDLARNPENGWSLLGLAQSLKAQSRADAEADARNRLEKAWRQADVRPAASDF
jgi:tetratricopeptide (TPR) repeat protein